MYGSSETVAGDLIAELGMRDKLFVATKVWTSGRDEGIRQMETSFKRLRVERMDLMQVHNLVDVDDAHEDAAGDGRAKKRVRYIGITHYTSSAYGEVERWLKTRQYDFLQINYSLGEREAEKRILPTGARAESRRHRQPPLRRRRAVQTHEGQAAAALGRGARHRELGAVLPEVDRLAPGGDLRHPRHRQPEAHGRTTSAPAAARCPTQQRASAWPSTSMHKVEIRREIVERVLARRGRLHLFDSLDPKRTALLVIDMQNAFVAPGAPIEVPAARAIVAPINRLAADAAQARRAGDLGAAREPRRRPRLGRLLRRFRRPRPPRRSRRRARRRRRAAEALSGARDRAAATCASRRTATARFIKSDFEKKLSKNEASTRCSSPAPRPTSAASAPRATR